LSLALRYGRLCNALSSQGDYVVISTISLFKEVHQWNRANLPGYLEIYLKVPLDELRRRDTKGIYKLYDCGQIANVAGIDIPIDEPINADFVYDFTTSPEFNKLSRAIMEKFIEDNN
jgi:cytidine diphosphoramidate kinase